MFELKSFNPKPQTFIPEGQWQDMGVSFEIRPLTEGQWARMIESPEDQKLFKAFQWGVESIEGVELDGKPVSTAVEFLMMMDKVQNREVTNLFRLVASRILEISFMGEDVVKN